MSKGLRKSAAKLEREAVERVEIIRRAAREYRESVQEGPTYSLDQQAKKQREIESRIAEYVQIHKALKRIRRKMRLNDRA